MNESGGQLNANVNNNQSDADALIAEAETVAIAPCAQSTARRYKKSIELYVQSLKDLGIEEPFVIGASDVTKRRNTIRAAIKLIYTRCGPHQGNLSAASTGNSTRSAIIAFWDAQGHMGEYIQFPNGSFSGNPGRCPSIQKLIKKLEASQRRSHTHDVSRAYQETHEDVRKLCDTYFDPFVAKALVCETSVDYGLFQAAVINCCQFGAVARADELLNLRIEDLNYSGDAIGSPVYGVLPITKTQKQKNSYLTFERAVHRGFCPLEKLLVWQAVLLAHGISSGPLFVLITKNELQPGRSFPHSSYADSLKVMSDSCGIPTLKQHSARRGGLGYNYFVLRRDLLFLYRTFSWATLSEMIKYLGLEDEVNSYALLGFSDLNINEI